MDLFTASFLMLHLIDWRQTRYIAKTPETYYEANAQPFIGKHPSVKAVDNYFLVSGAAILLADKYLDHNKVFRTIIIVNQSKCVYGNMMIGIKMDL